MALSYHQRRWGLISLLTMLVGSVVADLTEQNATICNWAQSRAGVIRDTIYLDGGEMWWKVGFADDNTNLVTNNGNQQGFLYYFNFSEPFDTTTTNLTALFQSKPKAGGAANNIAPNYIDGTMFANDDELYLYGGLLRLTDAYNYPGPEDVLGYEAYQYGPERSSWSPGFIEGSTGSEVTRYVTNGAGVNVPNENLGFYFSGMKAADGGPIYKDDDSANVTATSLIEVDLSTMRSESWTNHTLPDSVKPRANAQLAWVPVSDKGVLLAIGGVNPPEEIFVVGLNSSQESESKADSPTFMTSIPVYDIANGDWYIQQTSGDAPPQLTSFCSVVASAPDGSSHNVYIYGGYDGLNAVDLPSDDVWVLSVPAFKWVKVYSGTSSHGRSGHVCTAPYPDQMLIFGGLHQDPTQCVDGIIQVFNLNTLDFQDSYSPSTWSHYEVPDKLSAVIGGNSQGGATAKATWSDHKLEALFGAKYTKPMKHYYPYSTDYSIAGDPSSSSSRSGLPTWAIIVLGVVLGILLVMAVMIAWLMVRRRKLIKEHSLNGTYASDESSRIMRWVHGMPAHPPTTKPPSSIYSTSGESHSGEPIIAPAAIPADRAEASSTERFELHSDSLPEKKPQEMATPYNSKENWSGSTTGIGVARGSSLYDDNMTYQGNDMVSPLPTAAHNRGASWLSTNRSATDTSSSDESRRLSPYFPGNTPRTSYMRQMASGENFHVVSPVSEEGTYHPGWR